MRKQQQGFTLIEIAIVLVIIGLLLGGVLKGQELIQNARVRNIISQQDGIRRRISGFKTVIVACRAITRQQMPFPIYLALALVESVQLQFVAQPPMLVMGS